MNEGGKKAVRADDEVVAASEVRRLEERVRDLERLLGRKTMEVERTTTQCTHIPGWAIAHPGSTSFHNPSRVRFNEGSTPLSCPSFPGAGE